MAGRIVAKKAVKRRPGYLYYVDAQGNVRESKLHRGGRKKKKKTAKKKTAKRKTKRKTTRKKKKR